MGGLSEVDPSIAKNAACLSICVWRKDNAAMIYFPNAAWVSFPLSTLTENATTHFLCAIAGADLSIAPLLTASANMFVFLALCSEPLGKAPPDPFFPRDPFIASKFGVSPLSVGSPLMTHHHPISSSCFVWRDRRPNCCGWTFLIVLEASCKFSSGCPPLPCQPQP